VPVTPDSADEADEDFTVALTSSAAVDPNAGTAKVTILDDDGPAVSVNDVTVKEGNAGSQPAAFVVSLSAPSAQVVSVDYATAAGTASAPDDFTPANGTVTFNPGDTAKEVSPAPSVAGDTVDEPDETFSLTLSNPVNATVAKAIGLATIVDDDHRAVSVADVSGPEGDVADTLTFTLTLDGPSTLPTSLSYATVDGTARAGVDYAPWPVGSRSPSGRRRRRSWWPWSETCGTRRRDRAARPLQPDEPGPRPGRGGGHDPRRRQAGLPPVASDGGIFSSAAPRSPAPPGPSS